MHRMCTLTDRCDFWEKQNLIHPGNSSQHLELERIEKMEGDNYMHLYYSHTQLNCRHYNGWTLALINNYYNADSRPNIPACGPARDTNTRTLWSDMCSISALHKRAPVKIQGTGKEQPFAYKLMDWNTVLKYIMIDWKPIIATDGKHVPLHLSYSFQ